MTKQLRQFVVVLLSFLIGIEGIVVIIGWVFEIDSLTRATLHGVNMSFPTAWMFLLSSFGLYFIYRKLIQNDSNYSTIILSFVSLLIFMINITIVSGGILGTHTGMENLFLQNKNSFDTNLIAGIPAWSSLLCFTLFALTCGMSLYSISPFYSFIRFTGYFIAIFGLLASIGYFINMPILYYKFSPSMVPMALNTALTFILLGIGLITISVKKVGET